MYTAITAYTKNIIVMFNLVKTMCIWSKKMWHRYQREEIKKGWTNTPTVHLFCRLHICMHVEQWTTKVWFDRFHTYLHTVHCTILYTKWTAYFKGHLFVLQLAIVRIKQTGKNSCCITLFHTGDSFREIWSS